MQYLKKNNVLLIGSLFFIVLSCSPSKEEVFRKEVAQQNKLYPAMVDAYTRIDSIEYTEKDNTFRYFYTVTGDADNTDITTDMQEELLKLLPDEIKRAAGMATHRKHHVNMEYIYYSGSSGNELFRVTITPDMYK